MERGIEGGREGEGGRGREREGEGGRGRNTRSHISFFRATDTNQWLSD